MTKQVINIGNQPNDGTGDNIRTAFQKTNENFDTLFAVAGIGDGLRFTNLQDAPKDLLSNKLIVTDSSGLTLTQVSLVGGTGIGITYDLENGQYVVTNTTSTVSTDPNPTLGGNLSGASTNGTNGYRGVNFANPINDRDLVTQKWVYDNFLNRDGNYRASNVTTVEGSTIRHNIKLNLSSANTSTNIGKQIVVYNAAGSTTTVDVSQQGIHPAHITRKDYVDTKISLQGTETIDPATGLINPGFGQMTGPLELFRDPIASDNHLTAATKGYVDSNTFWSSNNLFITKKGRDFQPDVPPEKRGRFYQYSFASLNKAARYAEKLIEVSQIQVGDYARLITYNSGTPATVDIVEDPYNDGFARILLDTGGTGSDQFGAAEVGKYTIFPGQYIQGVESNAIGLITNIEKDTESGNDIYTIEYVDYGKGFDTDIEVSGTGQQRTFTFVDTEQVPIPDFWIGYTFWHETTDAIGKVVAISSTPDVSGYYHSTFTVEFEGLNIPASGTTIAATDWQVYTADFKPGETIVYNTNVSALQISFVMESGEYYEQYPIKLPANTSIRGDEFRRVIIRPKPGISASPWADIFFRRDTQIDGMQIVDINTTTNYAYPGASVTPSAASGEATFTLSTGGLLQSYVGFVFQGNGGQGVVKSVVGDTFVVDLGKNLSSTAVIPDGSWNLYQPVNFGFHYLRDPERPMNVFTTVQNIGSLINAANSLEVNQEFLQTEVSAWMVQEQSNPSSPLFGENYDAELCFRDVGTLVKGFVGDLREGGSGYTINNADALSKISTLTTGDCAVVIDYLGTIAQQVIANTAVSSVSGAVQDIDATRVPEANASAVLADLVQATIKIVNLDPEYNPPKDNRELDVFLCNDANVIRYVSCQNHGGFMMVLDPEGQIKNKSPYAQTNSSFSQSIAKQAFRGGMFVDGFTGNLRVTPTAATFVDPLKVTVKGLIRKPQVPTFFVKRGIRYEADYFSNFVPDVILPNGVQTYSATLNLNPLTPGGIPDEVIISNAGAVGDYMQNRNIPITVEPPTGVGGVTARGYAVTNLTGQITNIVIDFPGTGYITSPNISVGGAVINNLQITNSGNVSGASIAFGGEGYTVDTTITISAVGQSGVTSVEAEVTEVDANGSITGIQITNSGTNWSNEFKYSVKFGNATFTVPAPRSGFIDTIEVDPFTNQLEQLELITAGNRSMLANDFTQVNDLGYGIFVTNGGFAENVSMFTYYCYRSYYSLNGAQIRSTTGSSCYGEYGLCAEGADPNEVPVTVKLSSPLTQVAEVYEAYPAYPAIKGQSFVYVTVDPASGGYPALGLSEIEVNHNGVIKRYSVGAANPVQENNQPVLKNGKPLYLLSFNSGSLNAAVADLGLYTDLTTGVPVTIRAKGLNKFSGIDPAALSRSTTSLVMKDDPTYVYHVTEYSDVLSDNAVFIYTLEDYNYISFQAIDQGLTYPKIDSSGTGYVSAPNVTISPDLNTAIITKLVSGDQGAPNAGVEVITLDNVSGVIVSQAVTGTNIVSGTSVTFVNTSTNQIGISTPTAGQITSSSVLTFSGESPVFDVEISGGSISKVNVINGGTAWASTTTTLSFDSGDATFETPTKIAGVIGSTTIKITPLSSVQEGRILAGLASSPVYYYQFAVNGQLFNITDYRPTRVTGQSWAEIEVNKPLTRAIDSGTILYAGVSIAGSQGSVYSRLSLLRVTGHDFVDIGTGGYATTRIPNDLYGPPIKGPFPSQEVVEKGPARVFYATTDQDGNFRVGSAFLVDQSKGSVTINAPISLNNLSSLSLKRDLGPPIVEFSIDPTMSSDSDEKIPTEHAIVGYLDRRLGITEDGLPSNNIIGGGMLPRNGVLEMTGDLRIGNNHITDVQSPRTGFASDAANKSYVDERIGRSGTLSRDTDGVSITPDWGKMTGPLQLVGDPENPFTLTTTQQTNAGSREFYLTTSSGALLGLAVSGTNIPAGSVVTATSEALSSITIWPSPVSVPIAVGSVLTFDPINQAATKKYVDKKNQLAQMREVALTNPQDQDLLMFNNVVLQPQSASGNTPAVYTTATQIVNVRNNTAPVTNGPSSSGGGSDITITRTANTVTFKIVGGQGVNNPITDHHIRTDAGIVQSKLAMKKADTSATSSGLQSDLGLAQFNNAEFTATNGWIQLRDSISASTGVGPAKLQHISNATGGFLGSTVAGAVGYQNSGTIRTWLQLLGLEGGTILGDLTVNKTLTVNSSTVIKNGLGVTGTITVSDGVSVGGSLYVSGPVTFSSPVTFNGTATYVLSTNTVYTDNIVELHITGTNVNAVWGYDDGKDIGHRYHYYNRALATGTNAALVLANDTQYLEWYSAGAEGGDVFSGATYGTFKTGSIRLVDTTAASSTVTGALIVAGGVGVGGKLYARELYDNNSRVITETTIGSKGVTSFRTSLVGLTPQVATSGTVVLGGTLGAESGGTGVAGTLTGIPYANGTGSYTVATAAQVTATIGTTYVLNARRADSAAAVDNGVYDNQSYNNPTWINTLSGSKIVGNISGDASNITAYTINQNLGTSNSPSFAGVTLTTAGTNPSVDALTPNNGTTGGIRLRANGTSNLAYLQVTNSAGNSEWANLSVNSAGTGTYSGRLVATGGFSGNGSLLTSLNADNISSGTVPTARLASGTANSTTFLRGDQTWQVVDTSVTINNGTGITGGGTAQSFTLAVTDPVLRNVTPGYTGGGKVNVGTTAPGGSPNAGDIWFDTSGGTGYTQFNSPTGWSKLPNGLIIQWGTIAVSQDQDLTTSFPTAFSPGSFSRVVISGGVVDNDYQENVVTVISSDTTSFRTYNAANVSYTGYWIAVGF